MSIYIVEKCGNHRQVWGPYPSEPAARKAAGKLYLVVQSPCGRLRNGEPISGGELRACVQAGSVILPAGVASYSV